MTAPPAMEVGVDKYGIKSFVDPRGEDLASGMESSPFSDGLRFHSILFRTAEDQQRSDAAGVHELSADLGMGRIVDAVVVDREEYDLKPYFLSLLPTIASVAYRQGVFRDLEKPPVRTVLESFAAAMRQTRLSLALSSDRHRDQQRPALIVEAALSYCRALSDLAVGLTEAAATSEGLSNFGEYLQSLLHSSAFKSFAASAEDVDRRRSAVRYRVHLKDARVSVSRATDRRDFAAEVRDLFSRLTAPESSGEILARSATGSSMTSFEDTILALVAQLFREEFDALNAFCRDHGDFIDPQIRAFDREIQFYLAVKAFVDRYSSNGLSFCLPRLVSANETVFCRDTFDLALVVSRASQSRGIVCNDFELAARERIIAVSGPNQGGKTTFARTIGQIHQLAALGCPVPGHDAQLMLCDHVFAHFEREEAANDDAGKLQDDLRRMAEILKSATSRSVIILNEAFTSTTLQDARFLMGTIITQIVQTGSICVCVTFVDGLTSLSGNIVSAAAEVLTDATRTFRVLRGPPAARSYAATLAARHGLTRDDLLRRVAR